MWSPDRNDHTSKVSLLKCLVLVWWRCRSIPMFSSSACEERSVFYGICVWTFTCADFSILVLKWTGIVFYTVKLKCYFFFFYQCYKICSVHWLDWAKLPFWSQSFPHLLPSRPWLKNETRMHNHFILSLFSMNVLWFLVTYVTHMAACVLRTVVRWSDDQSIDP